MQEMAGGEDYAVAIRVSCPISSENRYLLLYVDMIYLLTSEHISTKFVQQQIAYRAHGRHQSACNSTNTRYDEAFIKVTYLFDNS